MAQQLAHEIKNPLTPIKLSAERVLRRWQNSPESAGEILESSMMAIIQETEGLSALLNEFRTLSKPMEVSHVWTVLREPMEEIINAYSNSYPTVKFNIEFVENGISVKIDKNRLTQILTNLLVNAIDAMNGSGSVEIRTDIVKKHEVCYCRIGIKDSGKGISSQDSNLVFTPYFTTKQSGTGLGLPIIERIVNDHGGAIWFDSAEGSGTTFYIDLPAESSQDKHEQKINSESLTEGK
jgi:nitrogen fixation/metabolism regulation signal transduction histidine kinase